MGFLKKITKPISKVLDKIIPNEVKPFLPYAAAVAPFMAPAGIMGTSMLQRALISGGLNLGAQLAQEGSEGDFNPLSVLLAGGTGALTAPNAAASLRGMTTAGSIDPALGSSAQGDILAGRSFLTKAKDFGLTSLAKGAEGLSSLQKGVAEKGLFSKEGLKLASIPVTQGTMDVAVAGARREQKAYDQALEEFNRMQKEMSGATYNDYYDNILKYMDLAGFTAEEAEAAAERVLSGINFANGGRVGYLGGGNVATPPGMEMDLRVGGFIPIGQAERADDVLARVSKNEFVMTADAVRGMGNGDPRAGAQKMYQLMNNLEARV
jgi:hypothetical protein